MNDVDLEAALDKQALHDPLLRNVVHLLDDLPRVSPESCRVMKMGLLAFSKHAMVMQKVAEKAIALTPIWNLTIIMREAEKEVEEITK